MNVQLDLFAWADARPSNVIDALPALIRRAAMEAYYPSPRNQLGGIVVELRRIA